MNWYCTVHVLVPYNIKLYAGLRSSGFDYGVQELMLVRARAHAHESDDATTTDPHATTV